MVVVVVVVVVVVLGVAVSSGVGVGSSDIELRSLWLLGIIMKLLLYILYCRYDELKEESSKWHRSGGRTATRTI